MKVLLAIGIVFFIVLVFFIAPSWLDRPSDKLFPKILQGFLIDIFFGTVGTIALVLFYGLGRSILGWIIPVLRSGTPKEYLSVALCVFSLYVLIALYNLVYTIVTIHKHPGFKEYYLKHRSPFNMSKDDVKKNQDNKKQWGLVGRVSLSKIQHLELLYYYNLLGLDSSASTDEIKRAYREKAQQYHPDKHYNASENERINADRLFREIKYAYEHIMKRQNPTM